MRGSPSPASEGPASAGPAPHAAAPALRVLVVATQVRLPDAHGGSTHVAELVRGLAQRGPVLAITQRGSSAPNSFGVSLPMGYPRGLKHLMPLLYFPQALARARAFAPDVIYERASSYGLGALLSRALGVPMLAMLLDEHHSPLTLRRAARLIATTESVIPEPFRHKAVKVGWGANTELFHPGVERIPEAALPRTERPTICYVGSFKRWHGLATLVEAARLAGPTPHRTLLVGDGPLRREIEAQVSALGLSPHFVFTGSVPYERVPNWIAAADVCVAPFQPDLHPRSQSGFVLDPLKLFEYLAMGKPTISVDTENLRALFGDREHLRLLAPGDAAGLARVVKELAQDPAGSAQLAERGRQRVWERHTWAAHVDHLYRLFTEIQA